MQSRRLFHQFGFGQISRLRTVLLCLPPLSTFSFPACTQPVFMYAPLPVSADFPAARVSLLNFHAALCPHLLPSPYGPCCPLLLRQLKPLPTRRTLHLVHAPPLGCSAQILSGGLFLVFKCQLKGQVREDFSDRLSLNQLPPPQ